jgi:hypothetical protein
MGLFKKSRGYDCRFTGKVSETTGTNIVPHGIFLTVTLNSDSITIDNSDMSFTLERSQIKSSGFFTEQDVVSKNKNVVGRSIAGGLMFGEMGAVIGGLSGVGNKNKTIHRKFVFITYQSSDKTDCGIVFEIEDYELRSALKFIEMTKVVVAEPIKL